MLTEIGLLKKKGSPQAAFLFYCVRAN